MINCCNCFVQALVHACFTLLFLSPLSLSLSCKISQFFLFFFSLSLSFSLPLPLSHLIHSNREEVVHHVHPLPQLVMGSGREKEQSVGAKFIGAVNPGFTSSSSVPSSEEEVNGGATDGETNGMSGRNASTRLSRRPRVKPDLKDALGYNRHCSMRVTNGGTRIAQKSNGSGTVSKSSGLSNGIVSMSKSNGSSNGIVSMSKSNGSSNGIVSMSKSNGVVQWNGIIDVQWSVHE